MAQNPQNPASDGEAVVPRREEQVLALHAEEIAVAKRVIAGDTVRISKATRSHDQLVQETLTHQRIEVTHVPIGRYVDCAPSIREEGGLTIMPVIEEVVVTERRLLLKEEIHIRRVQVTENYTETVIVRVEEASVERIPAAVRGR
ncbi:YsnF/AvaK domain-containing protein (plasmid) [Lichenicola cladoniae]|uniref:YsnF/AvaK domain-containing protein n=1 Tax=Lichenicola cladoniae TaxID=1484109 RepID=A0A6M8HY18_9PROT|nr:DUF2382 domain-containing protein [Lichenicola cladoniae]NPD69568.1 YsnF/AvaK domain-containing protein [Acetobacteraceae bacterium]QKE93449.1 YsnF/AvaK domain-containing protein [Lichenicola cladoniae]